MKTWKMKKLLVIVLLFVIIWVFICLIVAYMQPLLSGKQTEDGFLERFFKNSLFFLGYGDTDLSAVIKVLLAVFGIIAISVMTTYLTINLFWRVDDVVIAPSIYIYPKEADSNTNVFKDNASSEYSTWFAWFIVANNGKRIADLRLSFVAYQVKKQKENKEQDKIEKEQKDHKEQDEHTEIARSREYSNPMLFKKSVWRIREELQDNFLLDVLYKQQLLKINNNDEKILIYLTLRFLDPQSGQECCNIVEVKPENICCHIPTRENMNKRFSKIRKMDEQEKAKKKENQKKLEEYLSRSFKPFDLRKLNRSPKNNEVKYQIDPKSNEVSCDFSSANSNSQWLMIFFDYRTKPLDWTIYSDDDISFLCELEISGIKKQVNIEIKCRPALNVLYTIPYIMKDGKVNISKSLKEILENSDNPDFSDIRQICFVIDRGSELIDIDGSIRIKKCGLMYNKEIDIYKKKICEIVEKAKSDKNFARKIKKDLINTMKEYLKNDGYNEEEINQVAEGVKAKLS